MERGDFAGQSFEGSAGVEDVVEEEDVAPLNGGEWIEGEGERAGFGGFASVAGGADEVEFMGNFDAADEIGEKDDTSLEDGDDDEIMAGVVAGDEAAEFIDAAMDRVGIKEDFHARPNQRSE